MLGASSSEILFLLTRNFSKWIILSNIIAIPVAYYFMHKWLQDFAYRIHLSWWVFVISGSIALFIALFTISINAIKAANTNPVEALRNE